MGIDTLVEQFLNYLKGVRGYSKETLTAYKSDLKFFFAVAKDVPIEQITKAHVQMFIADQKAKGRGGRTINRRLIAVGVFWQYLMEELEMPLRIVVKRDYFQKVKSELSAKRKAVKPEDARRMMDEMPEKDPVAFLAFMLMGKQGLRIGEARRLDLKDVNFLQNLVTIKGSKGRDRILPLAESVKLAILDAVGFRREGPVLVWDKDSKRGFSTNSGLYERVVKWMRQYGIEGTPHSWRKLAGTELYRSTKDIVLVQDFLGHANVETTRGSYVMDSEKDEKVRGKIDDVF